FLYRFKQIIKRIQFNRIQRMAIKSGNKNSYIPLSVRKVFNKFYSAHVGHFNIYKEDIGIFFSYCCKGLFWMGTGCNHLKMWTKSFYDGLQHQSTVWFII